ncbi:MAG: hypothetical protein WCF36_03575 [Candidatus Nanopelagicales bacterium]
MGRYTTPIVVLLGVAVIAVLGGAASSMQGTAGSWLRGATAVASVALAVGVNVSRRRDARRTRADAPDSVERQVADRAKSGAYIDAVLLGALALGAVVVFAPVDARMVVACYLVAILVAFYVRYLAGLRDLRA